MPTGSTYNAAQHATYDQMAAYLASRSGLNYQVALNWLRAEGSTLPNDPLGLKVGGHFFDFGSWQAALDASIRNLFNNPAYAHVIAAIKGGDPAAQRAAIVASPWAGGNYNHGSSFSTAGIPGAGAASVGPPGYVDRGQDNPSAGPTRPAGMTGDLMTILGKASTDTFTQADSDKLYAWLSAKAVVPLVFPAGDLLGQHGVMHAAFDREIGQTVGQAAKDLSSIPGILVGGATGAAGQAVGNAFAGLFGWIPAALADLFILALILILAISGGRDLLGD